MKSLFGDTQLYQGFRDAGVDLSALGDLSWPSAKTDAWKYTNLASLAERHFVPVARLEGVLSERVKSFFIPEAANFVFLNGFFVEGMSEVGRMNPRWHLKTGREALGAVRISLEPATVNDTPVFLGMNDLCAREALLLEIPAHAGTDRPLHIIHLLDGSCGKQAFFPRMFLKLAKGAEAAVWETVVALEESEYFHNSLGDVILEEGAILEHVRLEGHSPSAFHIGSSRVRLARGSRLQSFTLAKGARVSRNNVSVILEGEGAEASVNGLHALKGTRHADSHIFVEHVAPQTRSDQLYKCILQDQAHSVFNGRILVGPEAQLTNSYQLNKNLILSRECRVDTRPQLEIGADDVKCAHGATIGQLSEEELFYIETRGIAKEEAQRLLIHGFVEDVLAKISNPVMRASIRKMAAF